MEAGSLETEIAALEGDAAFLDLSEWHQVEAGGSEVERWLDGLVTAGIAGVSLRASARSLLLTPTGRVRADFFVYRAADVFLLLQPPGQPVPIDALLSPYVLSSDVTLRANHRGHRIFVSPHVDRAWWIGEDLPPEPSHTEVGMAAFEVWRVRLGIPWFPVDFDEESVPAEVGLEGAIDFTKGCFLGQESVAKVRNLGHPVRVVLALRANGPVSTGEEVVAGTHTVGIVTSAVPVVGGSATIARVRWEARAEVLRTASGVRLTPG